MPAGFHHVEVWVPDFESIQAEWEWLLRRVGFGVQSSWPGGQSWAAGEAYLTITTSPNLTGSVHNRRSPGVNHLAFKAGAPNIVDAIMSEAQAHGWWPLYQERYPHAGGPNHYAGWLENSAGFKVEIVALR